ncbi:hypothetical protein [Tianweitania sediminis]|uniref:Uncharacterized protein n=1 Tax=Tianweitania sediminis TaxID=1502156 RepID=A0A8J7RNV2_9HYPH|nr:hypothetical protein [Tianweitania sediminis]MBP0440511.1 hypothetical protein [Tianweitania sediminis]
MDCAAWIKRWEQDNGPATWAAYQWGSPANPGGVLRPFRRCRRWSNAQWFTKRQLNAIDWMVDTPPGLRTLVVVDEAGFWQTCDRGRCRRDRRCMGWMAGDDDAVPPCCDASERFRLVEEKRLVRDAATWALLRERRSENEG